MDYNFELLKEVLSVPTTTYKEDLMIKFLENWLTEKNILHYKDEYGNVYATKKTCEVSDDFFYPCVISHTDTVHGLNRINVHEEKLLNAQGELKLALKAYNDKGGPTGIGGEGSIFCF